MSEAKRILIAGLSSEVGGMETYIMNIYRRIDRKKLQFDFINHLKGEEIAFSNEILSMGGTIINIPKISDGFSEHYSKLDRLFRENDYVAVYYQANRKLKNADLFRYAKKYNVPHRIVHSHNTQGLDESLLGRVRTIITSILLKQYLTDTFACSKEAGEWMFPGEKNVKVVNNGIDVDLFDYNENASFDIRKRENIIGKTVYGTVGRMCKAKNSLFLVDVFSEIHKLDENSVFLHIGGGPLEAELKSRVKNLKLEDSYRFVGRINNVYDYLNAMDVFLLPSEHEGFPISLVEAQCSGLKCLVADNITNTVNITGDVHYMDIHESAIEWATKSQALSAYDRTSKKKRIIESGYDEHAIVQWFENYFLADKKLG